MRRLLAIAILLLLPAAIASAQGTGAKVFVHQEHLQNEPTCAKCHRADAMDIAPEAGVCDDCHDKGYMDQVEIPARTTHGGFWYRDHKVSARQPGSNCRTCHEETFCLDCHKAGFADQQGKINIHRSDFRVTHPILARADGRACTSCHEPEFCTDCHDDFAPEELAFSSHRRGWSDIEASGTPHSLFTVDQCQTCHPDSVLTEHDWTDSHAREARRSLTTCAACHPDGEVCLQCHSAREGLMVNPHPEKWDDIEDILNGASGGRTCRRCH